MAYPFSEDHDMIREAVRGWAQDWFDGGQGPEGVHKAGTGFDAKAWESLTKELGMAGVAIDEAYGGAGLGDLGRVVIMEELGASLASVPFLSTCGISVDLITACGSDAAKADLLPKIASGELIVSYCDGHNALKLEDGKISGGVSHVVSAANADLILLSLRDADKIEIIAIPNKTNGLQIKAHQTMDPTRAVADIRLDAVNKSDVTIIGTISEADLNELVIQSFIALAAECIGGAQKCLDMTLEYTGQRVQFDRTIASFQAIKHKCADMYVAIEEARSAVYYAATAEPAEKTEAALIAKATATEMFFKVAGDAIQLHGGIGFTWEYPLHFFFKRARANRTMFGTPTRDYERLAVGLLGDAA
ncbi:MAG: acyl-CoA/acyl-ACP dehydrogenase [Hyphomonadaceae bacterium]|nr:acyl-CoA/acyl-ACP dehydrogenase [Hyphomonadaceae bacterium]